MAMSITEEVVTVCDWCLQEARVQTIEDKLWRFWKIISTEDPIVTSHKNICVKCKSRYEGFSIYIERCKINASKVDELLSIGQVKDEPSIDIVYPPIIKKEISNEVGLNPDCPAVSGGIFIERHMQASCSNFPTNSDDSTTTGKVKKEPFIDIEEHLINDESIWKEEVCDPDYLTPSGGKGKDVLGFISERQVLPDSMVLQKKVNNNHMCTYCGKTFSFPYELKIHLRTHTGETPAYKCSHCNTRFTYFSALNRHSCVHTGEKPFKCPHCNKSFNSLSALNRHLCVHTGKKPFKCSHCNKSFTQLSSLNRHLRVHTGKKPFKCSHCNKSFAQLSSLNVHLRIHTGEKPFKCSHCNKSFAQSGQFNLHLHVHTGEKPFHCSYCDKSFTYSI